MSEGSVPTKTPAQVAGRAATGGTIAAVFSQVLGGLAAHYLQGSGFDPDLQGQIVTLVEVVTVTGLIGVAVWAREKSIPVLSLIGIVALVGSATGCAGKPAALEYAIAVRSYTAAVEAAAPIIEETVPDGAVSPGTVELVRGTFDAARATRTATTAIVRECEAWTAANDGDEDCPQATKIRAGARNVNEAIAAIQRIVDAIVED